jgi:uncharacterized phiE125 gp8 family phage protein
VKASDVYGLEILNPDDVVTEPISLTEIKAHLSLGPDDCTQDARLRALIVGARQLAERHTHRQIVPRNLRLSLTCLPSEIELPAGVARSVTEVTYLSVNNVWTVASASLYETLLQFTPPRILLRPNQFWPYTSILATVVARVDWAAGWADKASVPVTIKQAMMLAVGNWFYERGDNPKSELPMGAKCLLDSWSLPEYA